MNLSILIHTICIAFITTQNGSRTHLIILYGQAPSPFFLFTSKQISLATHAVFSTIKQLSTKISTMEMATVGQQHHHSFKELQIEITSLHKRSFFNKHEKKLGFSKLSSCQCNNYGTYLQICSCITTVGTKRNEQCNLCSVWRSFVHDTPTATSA